MNIHCMINAALFVAALLILPAHAQRASGGRAAAGGTLSTGAPETFTAIAIIDSEVFLDQKDGIAKVVTAVSGVDREFQPRRTELQGLRADIKKISDDWSKKAGATQDARVVAIKQEQLDVMKRDLTRKQHDAETAFQKRLSEVIGPIYEDISRSLEVFARGQGIGLVLDISKLSGAIFLINGRMDITTAFIADYNSKNTSTAISP